MALDLTPVLNGERMKSHSHALDIVDVSFDGDGAYPANGTLLFTAYLRSILPDSRAVTIVSVHPLGMNGGYELIYDATLDSLVAVVKATGVEVAPAVDLSGTTFRVAVLCY